MINIIFFFSKFVKFNDSIFDYHQQTKFYNKRKYLQNQIQCIISAISTLICQTKVISIIKFSIFAEIKNTEYEFYGNKYH